MDLLKRYEIFINILSTELNRMFNEQSEFIKCREGCSFCCESGEYPFSKIEFEYLILGYNCLSNDIKEIIKHNIKELNIQKIQNSKSPFMYKCPFLINKRCTVYAHRGIICRTFGLLAEHNDGSYTIPFCHEKGLNYSNVYDDELKQIVMTKNGKTICKSEPKAYRITRNSIQNLSIAKNLDINWGDSKTLLDYFNEYNLL